jgi:hypothetical protein
VRTIVLIDHEHDVLSATGMSFHEASLITPPSFHREAKDDVNGFP